MPPSGDSWGPRWEGEILSPTRVAFGTDEESPVSTKEETKALSGDQSCQEKSMFGLQDPMQGPVGNPAWQSDQRDVAVGF